MRFSITVSLSIVLLSSCTNSSLQDNKPAEGAALPAFRSSSGDTITGDFDGNGTIEYAWLVRPDVIEEDMDCKGACDCYIRFSDGAIPAIKAEQSISGELWNEGDLNGNGADELGMLPSWFAGCWNEYMVWALKDATWLHAVEPFPVHCIQWEDSSQFIIPDPGKAGNAIIYFSEMMDSTIEVKSASVPVAR